MKIKSGVLVLVSSWWTWTLNQKTSKLRTVYIMGEVDTLYITVDISMR